MQTVTLTMLAPLTIQTLAHPLARGPASFGSWNALDVAGFPADVAEMLVKASQAKISANVNVTFLAAADGHNQGDTANVTGDVATLLIVEKYATLLPVSVPPLPPS